MIKKWKSLSKKRKKLIAVIAAGVLLVTAAGYTVFIAPLLEKEEWVYIESTVERGTLVVGVTESGSLEYGISSVMYELDLDVSADDDDDDDEEDDEEETSQKYLKIEEVYVAAGQRIKAGDALIKFDENSVEDVRRLLENARIDALSDYVEAQSTYRLSALEAETEYQVSVTGKNYAGSIYRDASEAVDNEITAIQVEINQRNANTAVLEEKVAEAQEDYTEALEDYEAAKVSMEGAGLDNTVNFMAIQEEYLKLKNQYWNAKNALTQAQQNLEDNAAKITSLTNELAAAQARRTLDQLDVQETYQEAVISGDNAQITYQAQLESLKEALSEAEEEKNEADERLEAFETFVGEDGVLYAAESGIVTEISYAAGDKLKIAGVILSYATEDSMTITVDVTQEDVVDLTVGDSVDITFSAYEDRTYQGTIQSIDTTATARGSNTISYAVQIGVEGDTSALYGGMTADITFVTEKLEDVLYVSRKAIVEDNGKNYVYCRTGLGGRELVEVQTGVSNGVSIEILSGLEEGDVIYLASRVSSAVEVTQTEQDTEGESSKGGSGGEGGLDEEADDAGRFRGGPSEGGSGGASEGGSGGGFSGGGSGGNGGFPGGGSGGMSGGMEGR